jgi:hypothetical protein
VQVGWDDDRAVKSWAGLAPLDGDRTADACVVGLGGSGLSADAALVERGLSVVGVDAGQVASHQVSGAVVAADRDHAVGHLRAQWAAVGTRAAVALALDGPPPPPAFVCAAEPPRGTGRRRDP